MALPDVIVNITSAATPRTIPTSTGRMFVALATQRGSSKQPVSLRSLQDFLTKCGVRQSSSVAYDWVQTFFEEQGTDLWLSRIFGAGAVQASLNLLDGSAGISLVVKAGQNGDPDPGTWANGAAGGLSVGVVVTGSQFYLQVFLGGVLVETSPQFTTQADAVGWGSGANPALSSKYLQISLGVSALTPAAAAAANLAGGTDGAAIATSDQQAALDRIVKELGTGQVSAPGATSATLQLQVIAHAVAYGRFALLDGLDSSDDTAVSAQAAALYGAPNNGRRWGQLFAPWDVIPGLTPFSSRTVPPTARAAAQYARTDALGNPNQAAAGRHGTALYVQDLSQPAWTDAQRLALNIAGVTVSRRRYGGKVVTYGFRTLADQIQDADWSMAPNVRTVMAYAAQARAVGANHFADQIDGFGHALSDYRTDLIAPAKSLYDRGALYPDPGGGPETAFYVDTGPGINPPAQLAAGIVQANVKLRTSPAGEQIVINIIKTPITVPV